MRTSAILGLSIMTVAGVAPRLASQAPVAQLALGAGSVTDVRGVTSTAVSVSPSLAFASRAAALRLSASGTRFLTGNWAAGGGASLDLRAPLGRFAALTLGTAANATTTSYAASFATLEAAPALEVGSSSAALFVGVLGATSRTSLSRVAVPDRADPLLHRYPGRLRARPRRPAHRRLMGRIRRHHRLSPVARPGGQSHRGGPRSHPHGREPRGVAHRTPRRPARSGRGEDVRRGPGHRLALAVDRAAARSGELSAEPAHRRLGRTGGHPGARAPETSWPSSAPGAGRCRLAPAGTHPAVDPRTGSEGRRGCGRLERMGARPATRAANEVWYVDLAIGPG